MTIALSQNPNQNRNQNRKKTTGIGSLPHHNADAALSFSFKMGIPFLPQIPLRNPWEYMIAQALEGIPGLRVERDGSVQLELEIWKSRAADLERRFESAFSEARTEWSAFEGFEPSPAVSSLWQPFAWEAAEARVPLAKIQIAGPLTAQWALKIDDGSTVDRHPRLASQIYRMVLARGIGMGRRLKASGIEPLLFLDEPGLYAYSQKNPRHLLALRELKLMIQALQKEGIRVGLHCCGETHWPSLLGATPSTGLGLDVLSIDTGLSLETLAKDPSFEKFIAEGGALSLGVIPTSRNLRAAEIDPRKRVEHLLGTLKRVWGAQGEKRGLKKLLFSNALFTPACGLALHSVEDAELVLETLNEFYDILNHELARHA